MKRYFADYKTIVLLAYPVILSNAVDTLMMMVDRFFLSRFGNAAEIMLGAAMGGGIIAYMLQAPITGLLLYTNAMISQNFGRKQLPRCAQVTSQAMYWVLLYYPFMLALSYLIPSTLAWMEHDPALAKAEWDYSRILIAGNIFAILRIPLNSFFIASNRSNLVMKVSFAALLLNIPLNYWFIFDMPLHLHLGRRLGLWNLQPSSLGLSTGIAGAALATVLSQSLACALLLLVFLRQQRKYRVAESWRACFQLHQELLRYGLPTSLELFLNMFAINGFMMLFYSISPLVAAAGTITLSWDLCNFILLLGISTATTTLVGQSLGSGNIALAKRYTHLILVGALIFSGILSLWFFFAPDLLSQFFITDSAIDPEGLRNMSRKMLRLSAFYLLADACGSVMRGTLSGAGDTFVVMLISVSMHFVLLLGAVILRKTLHADAIELWILFGIFILLVNAAFTIRYLKGPWASRWHLASQK